MNRDYGKKSAKPTAVRKMAEGGQVGFWQRLSEGNKDDPGSVAYWKYGGGKSLGTDAVDNEPAPAPVAMPDPVPSTAPAAEAKPSGGMDTSYGAEGGYDTPLPDSGPAPAAAPKKKPTLKLPKPSGGFAGGVAQGMDAIRKKEREIEAAAANASKDKRAGNATKDMADRAATGAANARAASELRAAGAREAASEVRRESRGTVVEDDNAVVKGAKWLGGKLASFGEEVGKTVKGIANSKITYQPPEGAKSIYERRDAMKNGGMVKGYAKGGMVSDGRSYGKKC